MGERLRIELCSCRYKISFDIENDMRIGQRCLFAEEPKPVGFNSTGSADG